MQASEVWQTSDAFFVICSQMLIYRDVLLLIIRDCSRKLKKTCIV